MIEIQLTKGQVTFVDDEDAELAEFKWCALFNKNYAGGGKFLAVRHSSKVNGKRSLLYMHRVIMSRILDRPLLRIEWVDHWHGDPLLNIRSELRLATPAQNGANKGKLSNNTSGYKGVVWIEKRGKWQANIFTKGKLRWLGYFDTREAASERYYQEAVLIHGEFARLE